MEPMRVAVLTISDAASRGDRVDTSGAAIRSWAERRSYAIVEHAVISDDRRAIGDHLRSLADDGRADLVLTTGGTGFTDRDTTPEATRSILQREAPGVAEALRSHGAASTPTAWLSRGVAGIRGRTLVVNLPGSTSGVEEGLTVLEGFVDHAVQLLRGHETQKHPEHG